MANIAELLAALAALPPAGTALSPYDANNGGPPLPPALGPAPSVRMAAPGQPPTPMPPPPMPQGPPVAPSPALNQNLVNQYQQLLPPAPTPPAPAGRLEKLAAVLQGVSAGLNGTGPQFIQQLRAPQEQYQQQLANYQQQRASLGIMGLQSAQAEQARQQAETQQQANRASDREFQVWLRNANITDEQAALQAKQAFEMDRLAKQEKAAQDKQDREDAAKLEAARRRYEGELASKDDAPAAIARNIADYVYGKTNTLTPAAEQWRSRQAKLSDAKAERLARIAAGAGREPKVGPTVIQLTDPNGNVVNVDASKLQRNSISGQYLLPPGYKYTGIGTPSLQKGQPQVKQSNPANDPGGLNPYIRR